MIITLIIKIKKIKLIVSSNIMTNNNNKMKKRDIIFNN